MDLTHLPCNTLILCCPSTSEQQQYPSSRPTARPIAAASPPAPNNIHGTTTAGWIVIGIVLFFTFAGLIAHYFFIHLPDMQKEKEKRILAKQASQVKG